MTIILDHTIVPVADRHRSARLLDDLIAVAPGRLTGPFVPIQVTSELTLDFDERFGARPGHYAFLVDDPLFDRALDKAIELALEWGPLRESSTVRSTTPAAVAGFTSATPTVSLTSLGAGKNAVTRRQPR
ncbi:MAG: hypothetical protein ACR2OB_11260 [Solirubrobacteraceae bacterium]